MRKLLVSIPFLLWPFSFFQKIIHWARKGIKIGGDLDFLGAWQPVVNFIWDRNEFIMPAIGLGWIGYILQSEYRKKRNRCKIPTTTETKVPPLQSELVEPPVSRIPTTIDPEQSQISYYGPEGLRVEVYVRIENGLDVEARLSKLELEAETDQERLSCRFLAFHPDPFVGYIEQVDDIVLDAKKRIKGWVYFQRREGLRIDKFKRFVLTVQAIGEPEETYTFEPCDWGNARLETSTIVMLTTGTDT